MTNAKRNKLLAVIRAGMDLEVLPVQLNDEECNTLFKIATRQSIVPILYRGLRKMITSERVIKQYEIELLKDIRRSVHIDNSLKGIEFALNGAGISYIPLKGAVLRYLYPEKYLRTCCDIDVLVNENNLDKAIKAIESTTDFKFEKRNYHDVSMLSPYYHLELHFSILENMENIDKHLIRVWDNAVPVHDNKYALTPEFQLFHIIAHMSYHMVHGGLGIRPFLDLWLLRNKTVYDEEVVRQMCQECGILVFYEKCCDMVYAWMTGEEVPEDLALLDNYALNGGLFGNAESIMASKQRKYRGISYIYHRLFMNRLLLETEYTALSTQPNLLPIFQIKRWLRLLDPKKRKQVITEISKANAIDNGAIESFDKLLTTLGL